MRRLSAGRTARHRLLLARRLAPRLALLVALLGVLALAGPASAGGRRTTWFRVELATGAVVALPDGERPARMQVHAPGAPRTPPRAATYDEKGVVRAAGAHGRPGLELALGRAEYEWMPWAVRAGGTLVFAWRVHAAASDAYVDVWRGVDVATGRELWRHDAPAHDPPGAAPVGDRHVLVDGAGEAVLVEAASGRVVRRLAKTSERSFSATGVAGGAVLAETGGELHLLDRRGATIWQVSKQGPLVSITRPGTPAVLAGETGRLRRAGTWLVKTELQTLRIEPARGLVAWAAESTSASPPLLAGGRIYEAVLRVRSVGDAEVALLERRLADGAVVREVPVERTRQFFDVGQAWLPGLAGRAIYVATEWTILD